MTEEEIRDIMKLALVRADGQQRTRLRREGRRNEALHLTPWTDRTGNGGLAKIRAARTSPLNENRPPPGRHCLQGDGSAGRCP